MKKFRTIAIIAASAFLLVIGSQTASAQKVSLNTTTGKKVLDAKTISCTFSVEDISSKADADKLAAKLGVQGIHKAEVKNFSGNKADIVLTLPKANGGRTIQNVFGSAGISTLYVDGKAIKTSEFAATMQKNKK